MTKQSTGEPSKNVLERVKKARNKASQRFQGEKFVRCNAQMLSRHLGEYCTLDQASNTLLEGAIKRLGLSARAMDRVLKVARTIADLANEDNLQINHVAEAIQYRTIDRMN
jgi:magnesium chelatase family protein